MLKVIGGYLTGEKESEINGKTVKWDNVVLYCISDYIPDDKIALGFFGAQCTTELKLKRKEVTKIGFNDWDELVNKEIEIIYEIFSGKAVAKAVKLVSPITK